MTLLLVENGAKISANAWKLIRSKFDRDFVADIERRKIAGSEAMRVSPLHTVSGETGTRPEAEL